jgi:hypothetical protein
MSPVNIVDHMYIPTVRLRLKCVYVSKRTDTRTHTHTHQSPLFHFLCVMFVSFVDEVSITIHSYYLLQQT